MGQKYPWIEAGTILVEPFRDTKLTVLSPLDDDNLEYTFRLGHERKDFFSATLTGTVVNHNFPGAGWWKVVLEEATKRNHKARARARPSPRRARPPRGNPSSRPPRARRRSSARRRSA